MRNNPPPTQPVAARESKRRRINASSTTAADQQYRSPTSSVPHLHRTQRLDHGQSSPQHPQHMAPQGRILLPPPSSHQQHQSHQPLLPASFFFQSTPSNPHSTSHTSLPPASSILAPNGLAHTAFAGPSGPQALHATPIQHSRASAFSPTSASQRDQSTFASYMSQGSGHNLFMASSASSTSTSSSSTAAMAASSSASCAFLVPFLRSGQPVHGALAFPFLPPGYSLAPPSTSGSSPSSAAYPQPGCISMTPSASSGHIALPTLALPSNLSLLAPWASAPIAQQAETSSTSPSSAPHSPSSPSVALSKAAAVEGLPSSLITTAAPMSHLVWTVIQLLGNKISGLAQKGLDGDQEEGDKDQVMAHIAELAAYSAYLKMCKDDLPTAGSKRKADAPPESANIPQAAPSTSERQPSQLLREVKTESKLRRRSERAARTATATAESESEGKNERGPIVAEREEPETDEVISDGVVGLSRLSEAATTILKAITPPSSSNPSPKSSFSLSSLCSADPASLPSSSSSSPSSMASSVAFSSSASSSSSLASSSLSSSTAASLLSLFSSPWPSAASYLMSPSKSQMSVSLNQSPASPTSGTLGSSCPAAPMSSPPPTNPPSPSTVASSPQRASPKKQGGVKKSGGAYRRKTCAHCSTSHSSVWRRGYDNVRLCNACGLRWSRNKRKSGIDDETAARRTRGVRVRRKQPADQLKRQEGKLEDDEPLDYSDGSLANSSEAEEENCDEEEYHPATSLTSC